MYRCLCDRETLFEDLAVGDMFVFNFETKWGRRNRYKFSRPLPLIGIYKKVTEDGYTMVPWTVFADFRTRGGAAPTVRRGIVYNKVAVLRWEVTDEGIHSGQTMGAKAHK